MENSRAYHSSRTFIDSAPHNATRSNEKEAARPPQTSEPPKRSRRWPRILLVAILILGAIAFYNYWQGSKKSSGTNATTIAHTNPIAIETATAKTGDIGVYVNALGTVTPLNTVSLSARVAGQIVKVNYQEGQLVNTGDPLVEIDPTPFQAVVTQAEGQLARDKAQLVNAKANLDRDNFLVKRGVISKQEYDAQAATFHQSEGSIELDEGNLQSAKVNLGFCHITSPITGRAGLRLVDPGNIVPANGASPLVVITQLQPISVVFSVAEDSLPQVVDALHRSGELPVDAYDRADQRKIASGKLTTLDNQIQTATGTLKMRALFDNKDQLLFANQFVNVRLLIDTHKGVTLLPNTAIQRNDTGAYVYQLQPDQTVAVKNITVGTTDGNVSEVQDLEPGAIVAANNFNRLSDGMKVSVRSHPGEANQTGASAK